jgi:hypothetical protein
MKSIVKSLCSNISLSLTKIFNKKIEHENNCSNNLPHNTKTSLPRKSIPTKALMSILNELKERMVHFNILQT